jgi:hypothetical protein
MGGLKNKADLDGVPKMNGVISYLKVTIPGMMTDEFRHLNQTLCILQALI